MEYFIMLSDERVQSPLDFNITDDEMNNRNPQVKFVDIDSKTIFVDYFLKRVFLNKYHIVSDGLKETLEMYQEDINFTPLFIMDKNYKQQKLYWTVKLDQTDDAITNKFINIKDVVLDGNILKSRAIHRILYEKQEYIVINLMVAESILRRLPMGVKISKVMIA